MPVFGLPVGRNEITRLVHTHAKVEVTVFRVRRESRGKENPRAAISSPPRGKYCPDRRGSSRQQVARENDNRGRDERKRLGERSRCRIRLP